MPSVTACCVDFTDNSADLCIVPVGEDLCRMLRSSECESLMSALGLQPPDDTVRHMSYLHTHSACYSMYMCFMAQRCLEELQWSGQMQPYILNMCIHSHVHIRMRIYVLCVGDVLENTWVPKCS